RLPPALAPPLRGGQGLPGGGGAAPRCPVIQVYAILDRAPRARPARGASGEPLRFAKVGALVVAAGTLDAAPALTKEALEARDRFVRELAAASDALLPARWGSVVESEEKLRSELALQEEALLAALEQVRGCEQMT